MRYARGSSFSLHVWLQEDLSEQPVRFFVSEIVREKIFEQYQQDVPYCVTVSVWLSFMFVKGLLTDGYGKAYKNVQSHCQGQYSKFFRGLFCQN